MKLNKAETFTPEHVRTGQRILIEATVVADELSAHGDVQVRLARGRQRTLYVDPGAIKQALPNPIEVGGWAGVGLFFGTVTAIVDNHAILRMSEDVDDVRLFPLCDLTALSEDEANAILADPLAYAKAA